MVKKYKVKSRDIKMNKKGWIKIVEAFAAILLVVGVLLVLINQGYIGRKDTSSQFYDVEVSILREIQLDEALRKEILIAPVPIEWEDFPSNVKTKIKSRTPQFMECVAKICDANADSCELNNPPEKEIYAEVAIISPTISQQDIGKVYRQLKLFCWTK